MKTLKQFFTGLLIYQVLIYCLGEINWGEKRDPVMPKDKLKFGLWSAYAFGAIFGGLGWITMIFVNRGEPGFQFATTLIFSYSIVMILPALMVIEYVMKYRVALWIMVLTFGTLLWGCIFMPFAGINWFWALVVIITIITGAELLLRLSKNQII